MAAKKKKPVVHTKPSSKFKATASRCNNCGNVDHDLDINDVSDLLTRIDPGGIVPAGECTKCKCLSYPIADEQSHTIEDLLDEYSVGDVDDYHNVANGGKLKGILGWFWVCNREGVYAYFSKESDAFRFRLAEINRRLNG